MTQLILHLTDGEQGLLRSLEDRSIDDRIPNSLEELIFAVELANYLYVVGRREEAKKYLLKFVYLDSNLNDDDAWNWNGFGLAILATLAREENDLILCTSYQKALQTDDGLPDDRSSFIKKYIEKYFDTVNHVTNHVDLSDTSDFEDSCEYLCDINMQLRFFYELLFKADTPSLWTKWRLSKLEAAYLESDHLLKRMLLNRSVE